MQLAPVPVAVGGICPRVFDGDNASVDCELPRKIPSSASDGSSQNSIRSDRSPSVSASVTAFLATVGLQKRNAQPKALGIE